MAGDSAGRVGLFWPKAVHVAVLVGGLCSCLEVVAGEALQLKKRGIFRWGHSVMVLWWKLLSKSKTTHW